MENFSCSLSHPIYSLLSNKTRLEILRNIMCKKNYGLRIASILRISLSTIHRHLKILSQMFYGEEIENCRRINNGSYKTSNRGYFHGRF